MGSAVDVVVNLRYPARGETSGIGLRMMGIGKGVLTSDGEGLEMLGETMRECAKHPGRVREYGLAVRERVRRGHDLGVVVERYMAVLREA